MFRPSKALNKDFFGKLIQKLILEIFFFVCFDIHTLEAFKLKESGFTVVLKKNEDIFYILSDSFKSKKQK